MTPPSYQLQFAGDPQTRVLYQDLLAAGETNASLDAGFSSLSYSASRRGSIQGVGDLRLQNAELFERAVSRPAAYQRFAGEPLPWQATGNATSAEVLRRFDASVAAWRRDNNLPSGVNRALAQHVFDWVTSSSGLGLTVVENEAERNVDQVFASGRGDCTESTKALLNLLSRVGFNPYPVWVHVDSDGNRAQHIVTGLDINGQTLLLDPVFGGFNQPHRRHTRLSLREFLAWHWNNRALDLRSSAPQTALTRFAQALQIDPNNPHILLNRGMVRRDNLSNPTGARADFQAALALDASFSPASFELGNMAFDAGNFGDAATFYRQAVTSDPQNPSYRRNLILALGHLGRNQEAGPHFTVLCRLDPDARDL
ncbi:MAG TPA: tetratricopeptide repeat protein, partial [bacterium]|nr:tetratricopeptide repeat protein [bacterium]